MDYNSQYFIGLVYVWPQVVSWEIGWIWQHFEAKRETLRHFCKGHIQIIFLGVHFLYFDWNSTVYMDPTEKKLALIGTKPLFGQV